MYKKVPNIKGMNLEINNEKKARHQFYCQQQRMNTMKIQ